jgi:hypothetical protein
LKEEGRRKGEVEEVRRGRRNGQKIEREEGKQKVRFNADRVFKAGKRCH